MENYKSVDVLFGDGPPEWEGWPIGRDIEALDHGADVSGLSGADRVEMVIRRSSYPDDPDRVLMGSLAALVETSEPPLVVVEGIRIDDEYDVAPLYFVAPASCIRAVISRLTT